MFCVVCSQGNLKVFVYVKTSLIFSNFSLIIVIENTRKFYSLGCGLLGGGLNTKAYLSLSRLLLEDYIS